MIIYRALLKLRDPQKGPAVLRHEPLARIVSKDAVDIFDYLVDKLLPLRLDDLGGAAERAHDIFHGRIDIGALVEDAGSVVRPAFDRLHEDEVFHSGYSIEPLLGLQIMKILLYKFFWGYLLWHIFVIIPQVGRLLNEIIR